MYLKSGLPLQFKSGHQTNNGHEYYRLGNDCIQFKLSHKPEVAGLNCGGWQYNKRNFTYFTNNGKPAVEISN